MTAQSTIIEAIMKEIEERGGDSADFYCKVIPVDDVGSILTKHLKAISQKDKDKYEIANDVLKEYLCNHKEIDLMGFARYVENPNRMVG